MLRAAPAQNQTAARRALDATFIAPTDGWIANRNLALPSSGQGAEVLENFFPTATGAILRRGSRSYAQLGDGSRPVASMFKYVVGNNRRLFAATSIAIYDITLVTQAYNYSIGVEDEWTLALEATPESDTVGENSTLGMESIDGLTGGDWSTVQFAASGGIFLIGVNGADDGFRYDGTAFERLDGGTPAITFPAGSDLTTSDLSYVWAYKNRLWFIQKESLTVWYLPVDAIGGELARFDIGSEMPRGGSLVFGQNWSLSGGDQGGLSEQNVFCSTEGEVAIYQGSNPADAADWRKVGLYRIGNPLGTKGLIRAGGDLVIATNIGFLPLSAAIEFDIAALGQRAISQAIEVAWFEAIQTRGEFGWSAALWPEQQMVVVALPTVAGSTPTVFVANARTGAWARFTNWQTTCLETFNGRLLFGSAEGFVKDAMVGGDDDGMPYTGSFIPLFTDAGSPGSMKIARNARATTKSSVPINERLGARFDFNTTLPPPPDVAQVDIGNEWDNAIWDQAIWDSGRTPILNNRRTSVSGSGRRLAPVYQVTSGSPVPLDVQIVSIEVTFELGGAFT